MSPPLHVADGWRYGALALPLAFVSLPLYVTLPHHYAQQFGVPMAALGGVLLATRALDALFDPWIGRWVDQHFAASPARVLLVAAGAAALMALGFAALWHPPLGAPGATLAWLGGALLLTYAAFSLLSVVHQAWGARWGGPAGQRARIVAWREGAALVGVVLASVLPRTIGFDATSIVLATALAAGWWWLGRTPHPVASTAPDRPAANANAIADPAAQPASPWSSPAFRALLAVFMVNGVASAIPATLLPFFVADRLGAPAAEPACLLVYFVCAAVGLPAWVRLVPRIGLARTWLAGMAVSVLAFGGALLLRTGDVAPFLAVCAASGLALGADLAVPGALLTGVAHSHGARGAHEGQYFGWWACATKLNLAAAAGVVLPLLEWVGYRSGSQQPGAFQALSLTYAALPCVFKILAAGTLWRAMHRHPALGVHA